MKSPQQKKNEQTVARKLIEDAKSTKLDIDSKKQIAILWDKLENLIAPNYFVATQEANEAYKHNQKAIKELKSYSTGAKMSAYWTFFIVFIASVMDAMLWRNAFKDMDGLGNTMANSIGLVVAIFGTISCAVLGRSIKQKSTYEEAMREDISGTSLYDNFTPFQKEVFDKNTTHDMFKLSVFTLGLCALIIPVVRWTTTGQVGNKVQSVGILSAVSYFIFAAVILLEIYNHCTWTRELNISNSDYRNKLASHRTIAKRAHAVGARLIKISLSEKDTFKEFMSNPDFQLLNQTPTYTYGQPKLSLQEQDKTFDEQE